MTDNEIIKAFRCCYLNEDECEECPCFKDGHCTDYGDVFTIVKQVLDLINRLQAENERLKAEDEKYPFKCVMPFNSMVCSKSIEDYDRLIGDIGADAIKEFAERLQIRCIKQDGCLWSSDIGAELKEMVGED